MKTKLCSKCGPPEKPISEFGKCNPTDLKKKPKDGLNSACRGCINQSKSNWAAEHPEASKAAKRKYRVGHREGSLWSLAKWRAKRAGLPFSITRRDVVIPAICPVLGILLAFAESRHTGNSPSLDRIVPKLGYVPGNVAVISFKANTMKSYGTLDDHRKLVAWMEKQEVLTL